MSNGLEPCEHPLCGLTVSRYIIYNFTLPYVSLKLEVSIVCYIVHAQTRKKQSRSRRRIWSCNIISVTFLTHILMAMVGMWCIIHRIPIFRTWLNGTCRLMGYPISWNVQCEITVGGFQHSNIWCLLMCVPLSSHVIYIFDGWYNTGSFLAWPLWDYDLWKFVWI